jgi:hypothetical protein
MEEAASNLPIALSNWQHLHPGPILPRNLHMCLNPNLAVSGKTAMLITSRDSTQKEARGMTVGWGFVLLFSG